MGKIEYIVMIVGAGGTGGNFIKEFSRFLGFYHNQDVTVRTLLIDGDLVEASNMERQPFMQEDMKQNKALVLASAVSDAFGLSDVSAYPHYIDSEKGLRELFDGLASYKNDGIADRSIPLLIGCVDNHRARQVMHSFFESMDNSFYFDSANEFSVGEVVLGARIHGELIAPDRAFYYPDILRDDTPGRTEVSCETVNVGTPQHLATNLFAANLLFDAVVMVLSEGVFAGGIIYFDRKQFFSRFDSFESIQGRTASTEIRKGAAAYA